MTFADQLIRDCGDYGVSIVRYDDGDILIKWRVDMGATIAKVARRLPIDDELLGVTGPRWNRCVCLHVPKDIAEGN